MEFVIKRRVTLVFSDTIEAKDFEEAVAYSKEQIDLTSSCFTGAIPSDYSVIGIEEV